MRRVHAALLGIVTAVCLSACSAAGELGALLPTDGPGAETPAAPLTTPASQLTPPPVIIACEIVSVDDLSSLSPFETAMANAEDTGGCHFYPNVETQQRPASIDVVVESYASPDEAADSLAAIRQELSTNDELELTIADVSGVGDTAFSRVDRIGDESGVWSTSGPFLIKVTMRGEFEDNMGPTVPAQDKLDSAEQINNLIISRLP